MQVSVRALSHTFSGLSPAHALDGLSFEVPSGQFVAIVGPSGCGKSTLLRLAASLLQPTRGSIGLDGLEPCEAARQRRIAWMAQAPALLPWLTARQNVDLAARFRARRNGHALEPQDALRRVGLLDAQDAYPRALSGGMQQRLALARLLTSGAGLWLMDEPFAALDELTRERLGSELQALWAPLRPTVLWVTHNLHEALRLADRLLVFTPRPARLAADLPLELPFPRREADPAVQSLLEQVRALLGEAAA